MQLDWRHIRDLNGSQREGFEEFCSQLARRETTQGQQPPIRKGKPDAGVECYLTLPTGEDVAWQAKYFLSMDASQWSQLDDSVKTALEKHPKLIRYYVCVPLDLADARLTGQTSAYQRWLAHVKKWEGWAVARGMSVQFVWWGSHELLEKLTAPANAGLARFWFEASVLDPLWFSRRLEEAVHAAGPRYTPEINVELPLVQDFDAFGRTDVWVRRIKSFAPQIAKARRFAGYELDKLGAQQASLQETLALIDAVTSAIRSITVEPTLPVSFGPIVGQVLNAQDAIAVAIKGLTESERVYDREPKGGNSKTHTENPFRSTRYRLHDVEQGLSEAADALNHTETLARSSLLLLDGAAGMGKTHLLCDLANKRHLAGLPTVLLMGQRFQTASEPWTQILQQLDLAQWSAEDFVGALEAVAQTANSRLLVMIDALNEGAGRVVWPDHMNAFLRMITRSPWVAVVVSVRSGYEGVVLPPEVVESAATVTHYGFATHEYDASKTFFSYYGIESPSTPLLAPEYRSPLFLKTICLGLKEAGQTRLPRGFHGISQVFNLYTDAINARLARTLDFDPKRHLVADALKVFVAAFPSHRQQWLSRSDTISLMEQLLPGRPFQSSLYQGMVGEGLLVENPFWSGDGGEFVNLGYERLADHFTAAFILEKFIERKSSPLLDTESLTDDDARLSSGVLESLFVQAPEFLEQELMDFAPEVLSHWQWPTAYRQSLIWRTASAFDERTKHWFNRSIARSSDDVDSLEVVLTLASVPDHPWNADFLDRQLRNRTMADRDAWWTVKLHDLYLNEHSAVRRMIDWALSVRSHDVIEEESIRLVSLSLAWQFSSSHRFLRDRATKAAANLLEGRELAAVELVRRFAAVDDLYVRERVLAVAYGIAMRSKNVAGIKELADAVIETVFAKRPVVAHHLLRDYARGVIERLHSLSPQPEEKMELVRPPYGTPWPKIPSEESIKKLEKSREADGKDAYGARRIISSVMHEDFGRYVIGTNSWSTDWLSLRLSQPVWRSYTEQFNEIRASSSVETAAYWDAYRSAETNLSHASGMKLLAGLRSQVATKGSFAVDLDRSIEAAKAVLSDAEKRLLTRLTPEQVTSLKSLFKRRKSSSNARPPRFDLRLIQRYVVNRVFDLGWTTERFNYFDDHVIRYNGREAAKAERIGKKYQWIAYHEICAMIADNFQFREEFSNTEVDLRYEGPWQDHSRDLDSSHSILSTKGDSAEKAWWVASFDPDWGDGLDGLSWAESFTDFPDLNNILKRNDTEGQSWVVADLSLDWSMPVPDGVDHDEVESRKFWCHCRSFLIRNRDVDAFMAWAEGVDFWGQWMPSVPSAYKMFLGEYLWSPAWKSLQGGDDEGSRWTRPEHGCPVDIRSSTFEYSQPSEGFDCSVDANFVLHLPDETIVQSAQLAWTGFAADFSTPNGEIVAQDPSAHRSGPPSLLLRNDIVENLERNHGLSVCWIILGERQAYHYGSMKNIGAVRASGACAFKQDRLKGFVKFRKDDWVNGSNVVKLVGEKRF